jgi:hypothetical protein
MEEWKLIKNTDNFYISNFGNFKKILNSKIVMINGWKDRCGYKIFSYIFENKRIKKYAHRLVAEYF